MIWRPRGLVKKWKCDKKPKIIDNCKCDWSFQEKNDIYPSLYTIKWFLQCFLGRVSASISCKLLVEGSSDLFLKSKICINNNVDTSTRGYQRVHRLPSWNSNCLGYFNLGLFHLKMWGTRGRQLKKNLWMVVGCKKLNLWWVAVIWKLLLWVVMELEAKFLIKINKKKNNKDR